MKLVQSDLDTYIYTEVPTSTDADVLQHLGSMK